MRSNVLAAPAAPARLGDQVAAPARKRGLGGGPILLPLRAIPGSLFSFETLLLFYMFAGAYKGDSRFAWMPVDATALFFALSVLVGSFVIVLNPIHKKGVPVAFVMLCLVIWFLITLTWSPSKTYGPDKVFLMATLEMWAVVSGAMIIAPDRERVRRLLTLLLLLAGLVGLDAIMLYGEAGGTVQRLDVESASYLMVGRVCGLGALVALIAWLSGGAGRILGWLCLSLFFGLSFVLTIAGGRGPLLATALPVLVLSGLGVRLTTHKIMYSKTLLSAFVLVPLMVGGLGIYVAVTGAGLGTVDRLERLVSGDLSGSAAKRTELYAASVQVMSRGPVLGSGAGSWPVIVRHQEQGYPHNLFLELAVEVGLLGVFVFLGLILIALRGFSLERMRQDPQALCIMLLFLNTLANAMVSGDLPGNRALFLMIGMLVVFTVHVPKNAPVVRAWQGPPPLDLSRASRRRAAASAQPEPVETDA